MQGGEGDSLAAGCGGSEPLQIRPFPRRYFGESLTASAGWPLSLDFFLSSAFSRDIPVLPRGCVPTVNPNTSHGRLPSSIPPAPCLVPQLSPCPAFCLPLCSKRGQTHLSPGLPFISSDLGDFIVSGSFTFYCFGLKHCSQGASQGCSSSDLGCFAGKRQALLDEFLNLVRLGTSGYVQTASSYLLSALGQCFCPSTETVPSLGLKTY